MAASETATVESTITTPSLPEHVENAAEAAGESLEETKKGYALARGLKDRGYTNEEVRAELEQSMNLQGAVITVIVAGATAYAGLNVMSSINDTMALSSGDAFYNSSESLEQGVSDFFTNLPTVFVVIALVLIIGYLTILR